MALQPGVCLLRPPYSDGQRDDAGSRFSSALGEFVEFGTRNVSLDGGEPLAHPHVAEIVQFLVGQDVEISMHTNGILMPRKIETIRKLKKVKISLDGPRKPRLDARHGLVRRRDRRRADGSRGRGAGRVHLLSGSPQCRRDRTTARYRRRLGGSIVFQPVRNSLFVYSSATASAWELEHQRSLATFARIEALKRSGRAVANQWSSLRHFRSFPFEARPPCAAGWMLCTMDPEGALFHCGERDRSDRSNNVTRIGVAARSPT